MIDLLTIALTHGLIALAAIRLLAREELDREPAPPRADPRAEPASRTEAPERR